jgi:hypothetical protein
VGEVQSQTGMRLNHHLAVSGVNPGTKPRFKMMVSDDTAVRKGVGTVVYYVVVSISVILAYKYFPSGMCAPGLNVLVLLGACVVSLVLWVRSAVLMFAKDKAYKYSFSVHSLVCGGFLLLLTMLAMGS